MLSYMEYHLVLVGLCGAILFGLGALEFIMRKCPPGTLVEGLLGRSCYVRVSWTHPPN